MQLLRDTSSLLQAAFLRLWLLLLLFQAVLADPQMSSRPNQGVGLGIGGFLLLRPLPLLLLKTYLPCSCAVSQSPPLPPIDSCMYAMQVLVWLYRALGTKL